MCGIVCIFADTIKQQLYDKKRKRNQGSYNAPANQKGSKRAIQPGNV